MPSLGLPDGVQACLFDLDGVLTETAVLHAAAWKQTFDPFLRRRADRTGTRFVPFDQVADYDRYIDGRPRADGIRSFLGARGISLPDGTAGDTASDGTVLGLADEKNRLLLRELAEHGVQAFPGSVRYLEAVRAAGLRTAVVSASANCRAVLAAAGLDGRFDVIVDGKVAGAEHLRGKPEPDTYLAAAGKLGVRSEHAAVFEDALAGVAAGRAGEFGCVVGVDRAGQAAELRKKGADVVVTDLAELLAGQ
jgi:beta-phosphoglucomutase family hydrolase